jgi:hypothetical protein
MKYKISLIKSDEGYSVSVPGLPGSWSQGATENEALDNINPHSALLGARFLYFSVAPNPLFHSVFHFAVLGGTSFYCMTIAGKRIESKVNVDF